MSKELIAHVMRKFKFIWENGIENGLKNSTATGAANLFSAGGVVSN
jgi:hypothetical protein